LAEYAEPTLIEIKIKVKEIKKNPNESGIRDPLD
jgi:hypothetical protein